MIINLTRFWYNFPKLNMYTCYLYMYNVNIPSTVGNLHMCEVCGMSKTVSLLRNKALFETYCIQSYLLFKLTNFMEI